jgi:hypothetical protein
MLVASVALIATIAAPTWKSAPRPANSYRGTQLIISDETVYTGMSKENESIIADLKKALRSQKITMDSYANAINEIKNKHEFEKGIGTNHTNVNIDKSTRSFLHVHPNIKIIRKGTTYTY